MRKGLSIKTKVVIAAVCFMSILTFAVSAIGYRIYRNSVRQSYDSYAETVLEYAYSASVKYSFGDMIADREMPDQYEALRAELNTIKECSDIEYLYAVYFDDIDDIHSLHYAINAKTEEELSDGGHYTYLGKPCEEGAFEDDTLSILRDAVKNGKRDCGTLSGYSDEYGHMLNGYHVIFDSNGDPAGLICVEIDINRINTEMRNYVFMVSLTATGVAAIVVLLYLFNTHHYLIRPIEDIAESSDSFVKKMEAKVDPHELVYEEVKIRSRGELRLLADNVKRMADGVSSYMTDLREVISEKERINTELSLAKDIQYAMLPHIFPPFPGRTEFDIYAKMEPAREVGGDFYDFFMIDDDHLGLVMADVSGKGVPAALFMMISKIILQSCAMLGKSPSEILTKTNNALCYDNQTDMFVTVWIGILEISTGKLTCSNAGHEYPIIKEPDGEFKICKDQHGFVIGGMKDMEYKEYELLMKPGSKLFVYTDGIPEATDSDNKFFGTDRMIDALNADPNASPEQIITNVHSSLDLFVKDAEQFDDLTMLCLEYRGDQEQ